MYIFFNQLIVLFVVKCMALASKAHLSLVAVLLNKMVLKD